MSPGLLSFASVLNFQFLYQFSSWSSWSFLESHFYFIRETINFKITNPQIGPTWTLADNSDVFKTNKPAIKMLYELIKNPQTTTSATEQTVSFLVNLYPHSSVEAGWVLLMMSRWLTGSWWTLWDKKKAIKGHPHAMVFEGNNSAVIGPKPVLLPSHISCCPLVDKEERKDRSNLGPWPHEKTFLIFSS